MINKKEAKELFIKLTNINVKSIEEIFSGFSNQNFLINDAYVLRIPLKNKDESINYNDEADIYNAISVLNYVEKIVYYSTDTGVKISKFIHGSKSYKDTPSDYEIISVAKLLKKFHKAKINVSAKYDMFSRLKLYKQNIKDDELLNQDYENIVIKNVKNCFDKEDMCLCHNDLVKGNILFTYSKTYFIDWEYAGMNNPLFDIASFISENNLNENQKELFLKTYFGYKLSSLNKKRISNFIEFLDILFYYWGLYLFNKRHLEIYKIISNEKLEHIKNNMNS